MGTPLGTLPDEREPEVPASHNENPAPSQRNRYTLGDLVLALTVVLGAVLRLRQYFFARSLWFDELMLATNVRNRDLLGLTRQLSFSQAAPLGFLWSAKASIVAFGQSELAYRLVPVIASIATVALVALVARRVFSAPAAIASAGMVALASQSIHYSSEFKQYSMEAAVTASLLLVTCYCFGRRLSEAPRHPVVLAVAGALAMICSISAVFVLAGVAIVLVVQTVRSQRRAQYLSLVRVALTWAAAAVAMYVVSWSKDARNTNLHDYWRQFFGPAPWSHPTWYLTTWSTMVRDQLAISWPWAVYTLLLVGSLWLARRVPTLAIVTVATFVSTAVASWAGVYPLDGRLLLFLVPVVCLFFGAVVDAIGALFAQFHLRARTLAASALAVALVVGSFNSAWATVMHPYQSEEVRAVLDALRPQFRAGDRLFIADFAELAFGFYRDRTGFAGVPAVVAHPTADRIPGFIDQINALGVGTTWILFARKAALADEAEFIPLHVRGHIVQTITRVGAMAVEIEQTR